MLDFHSKQYSRKFWSDLQNEYTEDFPISLLIYKIEVVSKLEKSQWFIYDSNMLKMYF